MSEDSEKRSGKHTSIEEEFGWYAGVYDGFLGNEAIQLATLLWCLKEENLRDIQSAAERGIESAQDILDIVHKINRNNLKPPDLG